MSEQAVLTCNFLIVDTERMRFKVKCPICGLVHCGKFSTGSLNNIKESVDRRCPKIGEKFHIILRDKAGNVIAPLGQLEGQFPNWDCPDCWGVGEYVGFTSVTPCHTCNPPNQTGG